jgi:hypothetical protein
MEREQMIDPALVPKRIPVQVDRASTIAQSTSDHTILAHVNACRIGNAYTILRVTK